MKYNRLTKKDWHNTKFSIITEQDHRAILHRLWEIEQAIDLGEIINAKDAEYRTKVMEIALYNACEDIKILMFCIKVASEGEKITVSEYSPEKATVDAFLERAKKELAKKKKNDN